MANIPTSQCNESSIRDLFSRFGKIINLKLLRDERTRQLRGTAFVRFDRRQEAEEAIRQMNGYRLADSSEPLVVKVSEEHGKQKVNTYPPPHASHASYAPPPPAFDYTPYPSDGYSGQRQRGGGPYRGRGSGARVGRWSDRQSGGGDYYERRGGRGGGGGFY